MAHMRSFFFRAFAIAACVAASASFFQSAQAQEEALLPPPVSEVVRAEVRAVLEAFEETIPGTDTKQYVQILSVELKEGARKGDVVEVRNDYIELKKGNRLFVIHDAPYGSISTFYVQDVDRRMSLLVLTLVCVLFVVALGGWYGARALISLSASLLLLWYVLIPGLASGWDPLLACFGVASTMLAGMIFFTHGPNRESLVALSGTLIAVVGTLFIAQWAVSASFISGFGMDASVYLNFNTSGSIDLIGLLIGGIVIGALGVLDDMAITQVAVVREIKRSAPHLPKKEVFLRAIQVGREHVGAVVNTLALAYVGVSLPLILLFHFGKVSIGTFFNMEVIAIEVLRTVVGTMGIVMAVPIVTALAVRYIHAPKSEVVNEGE